MDAKDFSEEQSELNRHILVDLNNVVWLRRISETLVEHAVFNDV